jgi:hypothetical protein
MMYFIVSGESPVVYEFMRKKSGLSERSWAVSITRESIESSIFHTSPDGPLP